MRSVQFTALDRFPLISPGMDLAKVLLETLARNSISLENGDILVLAQKIVSKSEGRYLNLREIVPSGEARRLAAICGKDPRLVEAILSESQYVVRCRAGVIIVRHRLGFVLANAGIDHSNLPPESNKELVLLLPKDPDGSAARLRRELKKRTGKQVGVMIIDSIGRAWRIGTCGAAIGASGFQTVLDLRGQADLFGRKLQSTVLGLGDELAAGASLIMGQASEGTPVVLVRGLKWAEGAGRAADLIRPAHEDLFS